MAKHTFLHAHFDILYFKYSRATGRAGIYPTAEVLKAVSRKKEL